MPGSPLRDAAVGRSAVLNFALYPLQPFFCIVRAFAVMGGDGFELVDAVLDRAQLVAKLVCEPGGVFASFVRELVSLLQHGDQRSPGLVGRILTWLSLGTNLRICSGTSLERSLIATNPNPTTATAVPSY